MYQVKLTSKALKDFETIASRDVKLARILRDHIAKLPHVFRQDESLKGSFSGLKKHRVGDYRIIYEIIGETLIILVIRIAHRREVYQ